MNDAEKLLKAIFEAPPPPCAREHYSLVELREATETEGEHCIIAPALSAKGCLCGQCYGTITYLLNQTPQLIAHIRSQVPQVMAAATYGARVDGTPERRLPGNQDAAEDARRVYATVAGWMLLVADANGKRPPGSLITWVGKETEPDLSAYVDQKKAFWLAQDAVDWFMRQRAIFAHHPMMVGLWNALVTEVRPMLRKYPQVERNRTPRRQLCPECNEVDLEVSYRGGRDLRIECERCGYEVPANEIEKFVDWDSFA